MAALTVSAVDFATDTLLTARVSLIFSDASSGSYQVVLIGGGSGSESGTFNLTALAGAPIITNSPTSQRVMAGDTVAMSVGATGITPIGYQWRFDRTDLAGQSRSNLVLNGVTTNQSGRYTVIVTNGSGVAESEPAFLEVVPPMTVGEALDNTNLVWTIPDWSNPWIPQVAVSSDGEDALEANSSYLETTVIGPALLTFRWRCVSNPELALSFFLDYGEISGLPLSAAWQEASCIVPPGPHTLTWATTGSGWLDRVVVGPPPVSSVLRLDSAGFLGGEQFQFTATGEVGQRFQLETSTNLVTWSALTTLTNITGAVQFTEPESTNFARRFYRVLLLP